MTWRDWVFIAFLICVGAVLLAACASYPNDRSMATMPMDELVRELRK